MGEHMPIDLVLVRHGESEGNLAQSKSVKGDESAWKMDEFKARHTSLYRLTDIGRDQAGYAGKWLRKNVGAFDKYYCSEYTRAMETAALLNLEGPWISDFFLRERDQGQFASMSKAERLKQFSDEVVSKRDQDPFYFCPPGGESIANACLRVNRVLSELRNECPGFKVVCVCHGNMMWGFRLCIEHMNQEKYRELNSHAATKLVNGTIIHYTRRNPKTGEISATLDWMRIICPWDESKSVHPTFVRIHRPTWTNEELLKRVQVVPQLLNNTPDELKELKEGNVSAGEPDNTF
eukprot:TRINITY_DN1273_c0_g1_i1.p1 TRINITY_DN1273_c0_g1~~TRINITY_DN1273_c0_g1_i1.p1  ORF type:complete len:292 (-),score=43.11 TRINITY_DN1273_c0_g1_i1:26-901(-)